MWLFLKPWPGGDGWEDWALEPAAVQEEWPDLGSVTCPQKPRSHRVIFRFLKFISQAKLATSYFLFGDFLKLKL